MGKRIRCALAAATLGVGIAAPAAGASSYQDRERPRCENDDRGDGSCNEHRDCENNEGHCSDDDFSPSFDNSPIIVCLPGSTCNFSG